MIFAPFAALGTETIVVSPTSILLSSSSGEGSSTVTVDVSLKVLTTSPFLADTVAVILAFPALTPYTVILDLVAVACATAVLELCTVTADIVYPFFVIFSALVPFSDTVAFLAIEGSFSAARTGVDQIGSSDTIIRRTVRSAIVLLNPNRIFSELVIVFPPHPNNTLFSLYYEGSMLSRHFSVFSKYCCNSFKSRGHQP